MSFWGRLMPRFSRDVKIFLILIFSVAFASLNFFTVNDNGGRVILHNHETVFQCLKIEINKKGTGRLGYHYIDEDYLICENSSAWGGFALSGISKIEYDQISLLEYFLK